MPSTQEQPAGSVGDINGTAPGTAARFNYGKPPLDLIPLRLISNYHAFVADNLPVVYRDEKAAAVAALECLGLFQESRQVAHLYNALRHLGDWWAECAQVFDFGRKKYSAWNWARGMAWTIPLACGARHLESVIRGESQDADSGRHHFGHAYCNIVMLITYQTTYPEGNDLPAEGLLA